ncbi:hypothetical protein IA929_03990 [Listeria seeligeri]|uniref:YxiG family protein n=1 Tax=Listeria seeligeri TaxID=1640 RepID=UPI0018872308|nr:hypothetical protein [Listeria seeligeri]MBF2599162.1 hypothetical protein [Listeria seeligeri]
MEKVSQEIYNELWGSTITKFKVDFFVNSFTIFGYRIYNGNKTDFKLTFNNVHNLIYMNPKWVDSKEVVSEKIDLAEIYLTDNWTSEIYNKTEHVAKESYNTFIDIWTKIILLKADSLKYNEVEYEL